MSEAPIDERYDIKPTLPAVSWDYEGTVAWAKDQVAKYEGLVVTEDQVKDIKGIMAEINVRKIALDNARKLTRKKLMAPLDEFDSQIKSVMRIFDNAYKALSTQVQAFTDAERESRRDGVQAIINEVMASYDIEPFDIPIEDKWLNKTATQKSIREAVAAIIQQRLDAKAARDAQEKTQQERAALIEQCVSSANKTYYGINLSVSEFMTPRLLDMNTAAGEVAAHIQMVAQHRAQQVAKEKQAAAPQPEPQEQPKAAPAPVAAPVQDGEQKTLTIIITYPAACSAEVRDAAMNLKRLCTSFSARKRD
ncbi:MAG: DUF1351 domain-containing protein [Desulfovibrio sp.]|nr:DUF1351 domain-containing protein [Desulfovibrio sp.]